MIAWSTFPGFVSYRDTVCGTCYIQTLCLFLDRLVTKHHLEDILKLVRRTIAKDFDIEGRKQMPNTDSTLTGLIYFKPKPQTASEILQPLQPQPVVNSGTLNVASMASSTQRGVKRALSTGS